MSRFFVAVVLLKICLLGSLQAAPKILRNLSGDFARELTFDGKVWRTTRFIFGTRSVETRSDEFHIRMMDDREWTVSDFVADEKWTGTSDGETSSITIRYRWPDAVPPGAPDAVLVRYWSTLEDGFVRKSVVLEFSGESTVDRLEVERLSCEGTATRGGRGEPVFLDDRWFFGLEYPAGHSRHTDGNTPLPDKHHFEMVGNYSFVDLDGSDRDAKARPGLIRLFHFPGYAVKSGERWQITSKTAVAGGGADLPIEQQFTRYLKRIQKPDRSFTHYNNWFDPAGKSLKGDNFVNVYREFKSAISPYGVKIDAMVPDDGWQNRQSVYEPTPRDFPGGFQDLVKLSDELRKEGTTLGLWLALDGTNCDVKWGQTQGFAKASANKYFSQYFGHYSLSSEAYRTRMESQLKRLAGKAKVSYFKHDFNHLSDVGEGNGHPPTDRHGHEANVDAMIGMLHAAKEVNPQVYQNLTNWVWFSPWWLMHGDALWMLAGDDGANGNWPELSVRSMASTDRDTFLWRMWGNPADRPLVPISRLMTHGVILNARRQLEGPEDGVREWADHVMMYYGRGIQMKEWYITPKVSTPDHWKALCTIHRWAEKNSKALAKTVYVGGRPDEGNVYGYMGWDDGHGVLVTRNPSAETKILEISFPPASGPRLEYHSRVVFPYHDDSSPTYWTGRPIRIEVPGYQTLTLEFDLGRARTGKSLSGVPVKTSGKEASFIVPEDTLGRAELLVIGYPTMPEVRINGSVIKPKITSKARLNPFPGYARAGMPSTKARAWEMASFDLKSHLGKEVKVEVLAGSDGDTTAESWLLLDRKADDAELEGKDMPWAIDAGLRRQTLQVMAEHPVKAIPVPQRALSDSEFPSLKSAVLLIDLFGVNPADAGEKTLWLNGVRIATLPVAGDDWKAFTMPLDAAAMKLLKNENRIEVRRSTNVDKFKFRRARLRVQLGDGSWVESIAQTQEQTTDKDWAFFSGEAFPQPMVSKVVPLDFRTP
jgi:hypothetical protein